MSKIASIYAAQILLGVIALMSGYAKITGAGMMVEPFQALGIGPGFLAIAGCAELVAGVCLLLPRGGMVGALLLTCVMVGALGVTIGHVASTATASAQGAQVAVSGYQPTVKSGDRYGAGTARPIQRKPEWSI